MKLKVITIILFIGLLAIGFVLAKHKPLWNDEIYSQIASVENMSYLRIIRGEVSEGNPCPLFYLMQKSLCILLNYHSPKAWAPGPEFWHISPSLDQIVLRVNPVVFMSLTIVCIFYYFSRYYSFWTGTFSLFLSLSTNMLWAYWAEARPYAQWVFLTTIQLLILLHGYKIKKMTCFLTWGLVSSHIFLSLTSPISIIQIIIISVMLWFLITPKKIYLLITLLPLGICLIYYSLAPKYNFWLEFSLEQYIREPISRDRLYILGIYLIYLMLFGLQQWLHYPKLYKDKVLLEGIPSGVLSILMILGICCVYLLLILKETRASGGFPVTGRYFINLIPVGIISTTILTNVLLRSFRDKIWMQGIILCGISYFVIHRLLKIIPEIQGYYPELFL